MAGMGCWVFGAPITGLLLGRWLPFPVAVPNTIPAWLPPPRVCSPRHTGSLWGCELCQGGALQLPLQNYFPHDDAAPLALRLWTLS